MFASIAFSSLWYVYCVLLSEIGNAYAVLSNPDKRRQYDLTGGEEPSSPGHSHGGGFDFHRGFEADITPEDLFNMFFGGGFPSCKWACVCRLTDEFTSLIIHHFILKFQIYWFYFYVLVMSRVVSLLVGDLVFQFRWSVYVRSITKLSWLFFNLKFLRLDSDNWLLLVQSMPYIMY